MKFAFDKGNFFEYELAYTNYLKYKSGSLTGVFVKLLFAHDKQGCKFP